MADKRCPIEDCPKTIQWHYLMCGRHWRQVPGELRREVWRTYDNGAGVGTPEYRQARDAAIEAVTP